MPLAHPGPPLPLLLPLLLLCVVPSGCGAAATLATQLRANPLLLPPSLLEREVSENTTDTDPITSAPETASPTSWDPAGASPQQGELSTGLPQNLTNSNVNATGGGNTSAPPAHATTAAPGNSSKGGNVPHVTVASEAARVEAASDAAALGASVSASAGAGLAMRAVLVSRSCHLRRTEGQEPEALPHSLHPTQWVISGSQGLGMVVGNSVIVAAFSLLCYAAVRWASWRGGDVLPKVFGGLDAQGYLRFPSAPLFVFLFLFQGTSLGAMEAVIRPGNSWVFLAGFASLVVCFGVPLWVFRIVTRDVPSLAIYQDDPDEAEDVSFGGSLRRFFTGPGAWVSVGQDNHWVHRHASVVRTYRQQTAWFAVVEFASSLALSAMQALEVETPQGCGHVKLCTALVFLALLVLEACLWPHARQRDSCMDIVVLGLQTAAMTLMAAGYYSVDGMEVNLDTITFHTARTLMLVVSILIVAKTLLDVLTEGYLLYEGRFTRLQLAMWDLGDVESAVQMQPTQAASSELLSPTFRQRDRSRTAVSPASLGQRDAPLLERSLLARDLYLPSSPSFCDLTQDASNVESRVGGSESPNDVATHEGTYDRLQGTGLLQTMQSVRSIAVPSDLDSPMHERRLQNHLTIPSTPTNEVAIEGMLYGSFAQNPSFEYRSRGSFASVLENAAADHTAARYERLSRLVPEASRQNGYDTAHLTPGPSKLTPEGPRLLSPDSCRLAPGTNKTTPDTLEPLSPPTPSKLMSPNGSACHLPAYEYPKRPVLLRSMSATASRSTTSLLNAYL